MVKLTKNDIERISELAKIEIKKEEMDFAATDLNTIFSWIDALSKVDVSQVPCFTDLETELYSDREDKTEPTPGADVIVKNAPESSHGMFAVPKVVE